MNKQAKSRPKYYLGFTDLRNQGFSNYLIGQIMFTADGEKTYIISEDGSRLFLVPAVIEAMKFKLSSPRLSKKNRRILEETLTWLTTEEKSIYDEQFESLPFEEKMKFLKAERESLRKAGEEILKSTEELIKGTEDLLAKDKSTTVCYNPKRKTTPEDNEVK